MLLSHFDDKPLAKKQIEAQNAALKQKVKALVERGDFHDELLGAIPEKQQRLGQFHTPDQLAYIVLRTLPFSIEDRVLEGAKVLDPSCGTGNFLVAVVDLVLKRLLASNPRKAAIEILNDDVIPNLCGIEIDPVMVEATKHVFATKYQGEVTCPKLLCADALDLHGNGEIHSHLGQWDIVIGNPPWVEVKTLPDEIKDRVQSKFELSNLYGAFLKQGAEFLRSGGYLAYVVPRSFTGGRYYANLRQFLRTSVSVERIAYFTERNQRFLGGEVLQEIVTLAFQKKTPNAGASVECIPCRVPSDFEITKSFRVDLDDLFTKHDSIIALASSAADFEWLRSITKHPNFEECGFVFSTGQLVNHRSLDFLRERNEPGASRVLYTHDIEYNKGSYSFAREVLVEKSRKPYAVAVGRKNKDGREKELGFDGEKSSIESYRNTFDEIILMRRRSHKGDPRRFVGIYVSDGLPKSYFIDNGLNFIVISKGGLRKEAPSLKALFGILRSDTFERYFEAVSSNTQINKNDMYLFGIPPKNEMTSALYEELEAAEPNDVEGISRVVEELYIRAF